MIKKVCLIDWCKTNNKKLFEQIDFEKNRIEGIELESLTYANNKKIWWRCDHNHSFFSSVRSRTILETGCPYCSGRMAIKGENDFATTNPDLAKEWDYDKNIIKPNEIKSNSAVLVWWKCEKGHSYESYAYNRIKGVGCPYCAGKKPIIGENDLKTLYPLLCDEWDFTKNNERPENFTCGSQKKVWWKCKNGHEWQATISHRTKRNQGCPYCSGRRTITGVNDITKTNPKLLEEWDYEKNLISPTQVKKGTHILIWWRCSKNHSWKASIYHRIQGNGCPFCENQKVLSGFNDLATTNPELLVDFDYDKNSFLPSEIIAGSDKIVWWKCSNCGYEWHTKANTRAKQGTGCPKCMKYYSTSFCEQAIYYYLKNSNIEVINGYRFENIELDIYIPSRKIAVEYDGFQWHKDNLERDNKKDELCKNNKIELIRIREKGLDKTKFAKNIFRNSKSNSDLEKVINELFLLLDYKIVVDISKDKGTIISNYIRYLKDESLDKVFPNVSMEWNDEKNGFLKPYMIPPYSNEKVWWKCSICGNEWKAVVANRTLEKTGCPVCAKKKIAQTRYSNRLMDGKSLFDKYPELTDEWDYEKNKKKPNEVLYGDSRKYWWKCKNGHTYQCSPNMRTNQKVGCPYCSGRKVLRGFNDLETLFPDVIKYWDYEKNESMPFDYVSGTHKKVWWKCEKGHQWEASIAHIVRGTRCPYCSGHKVLEGYNDLTTTNPELLKEWNYAKNIKITPNSCSNGSHQKVWWICKLCHFEWEASIKDRVSNKCKCPNCKQMKKVKPNFDNK